MEHLVTIAEVAEYINDVLDNVWDCPDKAEATTNTPKPCKSLFTDFVVCCIYSKKGRKEKHYRYYTHSDSNKKQTLPSKILFHNSCFF